MIINPRWIFLSENQFLTLDSLRMSCCDFCFPDGAARVSDRANLLTTAPTQKAYYTSPKECFVVVARQKTNRDHKKKVSKRIQKNQFHDTIAINPISWSSTSFYHIISAQMYGQRSHKNNIWKTQKATYFVRIHMSHVSMKDSVTKPLFPYSR